VEVSDDDAERSDGMWSKLNEAGHKRAFWEDNGLVVSSCEEYAYEKYYRYSKFEDFAALLGEDYREIYNVAYGLSESYDPDQKAKLVDEDLHDTKEDVERFDGVPYPGTGGGDAGVFFPGRHTGRRFLGQLARAQEEIARNNRRISGNNRVNNPEYMPGKNAFFEVAVFPEDELLESLSDEAKVEELLRQVSALAGGVAIRDSDLYARLKAAQDEEKDERVFHDWAYHETMSSGLLEYEDEKLYVYDELKEELSELLRQRRHLVEELLDEIGLAWSIPGGLGQYNDGELPPDVAARLTDAYEETKARINEAFDRAMAHLDDLSAVVGNYPSYLSRGGLSVSAEQAFLSGFLSEHLEDDGTVSAEGLARLYFMEHGPLTASQGQEMTEVLEDETLGEVTFQMASPVSGYEPAEIPVSEYKERLERARARALAGLDQAYEGILGVRTSNASRHILLRLYDLDLAIENILETAYGLGCYDTNSYPIVEGSFHPCDWSAKLFARSLHFDVGDVREKDFKRCAQATQGEDWLRPAAEELPRPGTEVSLSDPAYACGKSIDELEEEFGRSWWRYYTESVANFDQYLRDRDQVCREAAQQVQKAVRDFARSDKNPTAREEKGNDLINLFYEYDFFHDFKNLEQLLRGFVGDENTVNKEVIDGLFEEGFSDQALIDAAEAICPDINPIGIELGAVLRAYFKTGLTLFSKEITLLDLDGVINVNDPDWQHPDNNTKLEGANKAKLVFKVGGVSFFDPSWDLDSDGTDGALDAEPKGKDKTATLFEAKSRFMVGPVPLSITAGAAGSAGVEFEPRMRLEYPETFEWQKTYKVAVGAGAVLTPYAKLDAFAELAVDAVVLAAGVRADLTIIDVSLPFGAGLEMGGELVLPDVDAAREVAMAWLRYQYDPNYTDAEVQALNNPNGKLKLKINTNLYTDLDLSLRTLDGKVSLFVEVDLGFWDKTFTKKLFGWKGPEYTIPLFDYEYAFDNDLTYDVMPKYFALADEMGEVTGVE
jgi:hypothetical protein